MEPLLRFFSAPCTGIINHHCQMYQACTGQILLSAAYLTASQTQNNAHTLHSPMFGLHAITTWPVGHDRNGQGQSVSGISGVHVDCVSIV